MKSSDEAYVVVKTTVGDAPYVAGAAEDEGGRVLQVYPDQHMFGYVAGVYGGLELAGEND